jgi:hypothetical protein
MLTARFLVPSADSRLGTVLVVQKAQRRGQITQQHLEQIRPATTTSVQPVKLTITVL